MIRHGATFRQFRPFYFFFFWGLPPQAPRLTPPTTHSVYIFFWGLPPPPDPAKRKTNANGEQRIARRQHYNQHNPSNN